MTAAGRVLVVGSLNLDVTATVAEHPRPGETVLGTSLSRSPGGKGANQAVAAADAGASTRLVGCVGADEGGAAYLAGLAGRGVDVSGVRAVADAPTGTALVLVDAAGESSIVVVPGANAAVTTGDVDAALAAGLPAVLLLQLEIPLPVVTHAARAAAARGVRVVVNTAPYADLPADVLSLADPVVANEHEARLLGSAPPSLLVTRGAAGASWTREGVVHHVAAPAVTAVDATGAGDAFCGALAALLAGGAGPADALAAAVTAGSAAVTRAGAQGWDL